MNEIMTPERFVKTGRLGRVCKGTEGATLLGKVLLSNNASSARAKAWVIA